MITVLLVVLGAIFGACGGVLVLALCQANRYPERNETCQ